MRPLEEHHHVRLVRKMLPLRIGACDMPEQYFRFPFVDKRYVAGEWTAFEHRNQYTKRILVDESGKLLTVVLVEVLGYVHGAE